MISAVGLTRLLFKWDSGKFRFPIKIIIVSVKKQTDTKKKLKKIGYLETYLKA